MIPKVIEYLGAKVNLLANVKFFYFRPHLKFIQIFVVNTHYFFYLKLIKMVKIKPWLKLKLTKEA